MGGARSHATIFAPLAERTGVPTRTGSGEEGYPPVGIAVSSAERIARRAIRTIPGCESR